MIRTIAAILTAAALTGVTVHHLDGHPAQQLQREHAAASYCLDQTDWADTLGSYSDCMIQAQDLLSR